MINWPSDKRVVLAFLITARDENGQKIIQHFKDEYQRILSDGYKNLQRFSEYAGAVKTLETILEIFEQSHEVWEKMNAQEKGRM